MSFLASLRAGPIGYAHSESSMFEKNVIPTIAPDETDITSATSAHRYLPTRYLMLMKYSFSEHEKRVPLQTKFCWETPRNNWFCQQPTDF